MASDIDYPNRHLIPRLLPFKISNNLLLNKRDNEIWEMSSFEKENYIKLLRDWNHEKSIVTSIHILSYELSNSSLDFSEPVLSYLKKNRKFLNPIEMEIFNLCSTKKYGKEVLSNYCEDAQSVHETIKNLKSNLSINNYNPVLWCDCGYFYTILGQYEKAEKCYKIAINLNNSNRFVVKAVSRFFHHINSEDIALKIILKSPAIKYDISLVTAEIALSELMEVRSKTKDRAMIMLNDKNISLELKNELISQLATLEFLHGKNSKGKKILTLGKHVLNENSLAQYEFLTNKHNIEKDDLVNQFNIPCKFEALARNYFNNANFEDAFIASKNWCNFQPFSSQPAIMASYISTCVLENHNKSIELLNRSLKISPQDFTMLNNLAVSYASSENIEMAKKIFKKINFYKLEESEKPVYIATEGLLNITENKLREGMFFYNKSIEYFHKQKDNRSLSRLFLFLGRALIKKEEKSGIDYIKKSQELSSKENQIEIKFATKSILENIKLDKINKENVN